MKKTLMSLMLPMALSIAMSMCVAQDQSGSQSSSQSSSSVGSSQTGSSRSDHSSMGKQHSMSLTGCLQAGTEPNTYILSNVSSGKAARNKNKAGAPGEMARAESSYVLVPQSGVDISQHVGKRVRVTGSIESQDMNSGSSKWDSKNDTSSQEGSKGSMGSQSSSSSSQMGSSSSNMPRFDVRSIKQISNTCQ